MPECNYAVSRLLLLASLLLAACSINTLSGPAKNQTSPEWQSHQQSVSLLTHYQTRGTFAYLTQEQKVYARFNWQQNSADQYRLILTNPLGIMEMELKVQPGVIQLINNQGKRYVSDDSEVMIQKLVGMPIPLNNLREWMLGLPGDATNFTLDARGYLHEVNYTYNGQHWTVIYQSYHNDCVPALPSNLELRQGDNLIKLKMDSWSL